MWQTAHEGNSNINIKYGVVKIILKVPFICNVYALILNMFLASQITSKWFDPDFMLIFSVFIVVF